MEEKIRAACVQFTVKLGDVEGNLRHVKEALSCVAGEGAQLVVLPEMWSCGFDYRRLRAHAGQTSRILDDLLLLTERLGLTVVGSLPEPHGEKVYNTAFVVDRGALAGSYRKMHLFSLMGEDRMLDAGDFSLVAETSLGPVGVLICYDLRFPELSRRLTLEGARIIAVPGEWPQSRSAHWRTLLQARAIENQLFVLGANCCGTTGKLFFGGESLIVSPRGELLAAADGEEGEIVAELDLAEIAGFRGEIDCLGDRRPDCY
ncbi:carbon-nitrogen family hydrolase [Geomonas sp. RF6]|uniref:carbon-nitrogen family hydrolase n=1 Tax=Geomonas sp. RF6 TaxID=2897342 RepID=UPI001E49A679|nr:carbon-nitrogen family hydrolase [Geomonas sp. RF6]UFS71822.1 carbon-nitrogen family hydrolase [Geomonas sp. RF6]